MVALSVLDTAPVWQGSTPADSLRDMVDLAQRVERLGYQRYWVAEHHNTKSIASSSPPVLVARLASATTTMRVGSGGVMLPNHAPLVVAEQFGTLEALHPGRIDLGIGRAPGTDPVTARALRHPTGQSAEDFPQLITELMGYFAGEAPIDAIPAAGNRPDLWLLGSSPSSAKLAGELGLPYAYAHHINQANLMPAVELYRSSFQGDRPHLMVATLVIAADTQERAEYLASSLGLMAVRMRKGWWQEPSTPPAEAAAYPYTTEERDFVQERLAARIIGGPETVRQGIKEFLASTQADELMVITMIHDQAERIRCYELIAEAVS